MCTYTKHMPIYMYMYMYIMCVCVCVCGYSVVIITCGVFPVRKEAN